MAFRRILTYLLPLRILKGHLPSLELMQRFPVLQHLYAPFISAIRSGDVAAYDRALETREGRLLELNLWLTIEKAREMCLRGLFRRVSVQVYYYWILNWSVVFRWVTSGKGTRIPITMFHSALQISGIDVVQDEAECLLANMIFRGFMRGYISHEKQMVVLASTNAFPRVADLPSPYASIWELACV